MTAKFITIEGTEGAGKSTNIKFICTYLDAKGISYCLTREPGGTVIAEKIRELLLNKYTEPLVPIAELLLIFAARAQHLEQVIKPALKRNEWVISDRFTDATYAYQGAGRQLGVEKVELLEQFVQGELRPDKTLILDVPLEVGMERVSQRGELDRFEQESTSFFTRVRDAYLERASSNPGCYDVINASQPLENVQSDIARVLDLLL